MPSQKDIEHQQQLLVTYRNNLADYLLQQALLGKGYTPPGVLNGIRAARSDIQRVKGILRDWGMVVDDHPDDIDSTTSRPPIQRPKRSSLVVLIGGALLALIVGIIGLLAPRTGGISIQATQTAVVQQAVAASSVTTVLSSTATTSPTLTSTVAQTNTVTPIPSQALFGIESSCGALIRVLPDNIDLDKNIDTALEQLRPDFDMNALNTCKGPYALGPLLNNENNGIVPISIYLTNVLQHPGDIQIEKTFTIVVRPVGDVPTQSSALTIAAGAAGEIRRFDTVELHTGSTSYTNKRTYKGENTDYFFLSPGGFEGFEVPFSCTNPGQYIVTVKIPYRYLNQHGEIEFQPQQIICPKSANLWAILQDMNAPEPRTFDKYRMGTYTWKDGKYTQNP